VGGAAAAWFPGAKGISDDRAPATTTPAGVVGCPSDTVTLCSTVEFGVAPGTNPQNPFNTSQLPYAAVSPPGGGAPYRVEAFAKSADSFALRVTAVAAGKYAVAFTTASGAALGNCAFDVVSADQTDCGFVRVDPALSEHHFVTSGGNSWYGVGMNLAWVSGATSVQASWEPYLANLSKHGGNYVRLWLTDSWDDLFIETALGSYSVTNTQNLDDLLDALHGHGMKAMLCIESFNLFCDKRTGGPCSWDKCVYNKANGGFLDTPDQFFTDARAQAYFKMRLQYIVARYSASPAVFAWEFFNEVDITTGFSAAGQAAWVGKMAPFIKSIDPYNHSVSTSFCCHNVPEVFELSSVDFSMTHTYGSHNKEDMVENNFYWSGAMSAQYAKPTFIAEFGTGAAGAPGDSDPTGISLHNGIWSAMMGRAAMTAMSWWWDNWIRPYNLWYHFDAAAKLARSVQWHTMAWRPIQTPGTTCTDTPPSGQYTCAQQKSWGKCDTKANPWMQGYCCKSCTNCSAACVGPAAPTIASVTPWVRALGMVGTPSTPSAPRATAVLWLQNKNNTWAKQANHTVPLQTVTGLSVDLNAVVTTAPLPSGAYSVVWLDTYTATMTSGPTLQCGSTCILPNVPDFSRDIAVVLQLA